MSKVDDFFDSKKWGAVSALTGVFSLVIFAFIALFLFSLEERQQETRDAVLEQAAIANMQVEERWNFDSKTTWTVRIKVFNKGPAVAPQNDMKLELFDDLHVELNRMEVLGLGGRRLSIDPFLSADADGIIVPNVPRLGRERSVHVVVVIEVTEACGSAIINQELDARRLIRDVSFGETQIVLASILERQSELPDECLKEAA